MRLSIEKKKENGKMSDPTEEDLVDAVKQSLTNDGRLGRFKAEMRSAVMSVLNKNPVNSLPTIPDETKLINELLREYLVWNGYLYSEQTLIAESGQNHERLGRDILASKLGVLDDERTVKIPLLYYIISAFQNQEHE